MNKAVLLAVVLAGSILAGFSNHAVAGWHHGAKGYYGSSCGPYCFIPGVVSAPGCWVCNPYWTGKTHVHHGCRGHKSRVCVKTHQHRNRGSYCCASMCGLGSCAYDYDYRNDGCGSFGGGGCSVGGIGWSSGGQVHTSGTEGGGEVIYDGATSDTETGSEPVNVNEARNSTSSRYHLVSNAQRDGSMAFDKGLIAFRSRSLTSAIDDFDAALSAEPTNAMYHYYRALALYDRDGVDAAGDALQQAIQSERDQPISNWGKRMERVQGRSRLWVENARRAAGLVP